LKPARFVLEFTKTNEMVDAVKWFFDVTIKHGAVGTNPHLMGRSMNLKPSIAVRFVFANLISDLGVKNFGSAAGHAAQSGFSKFRKNLLSRSLGQKLEPVDFNGGPRFQM